MITLRLELAPTGKARPRERGRLPTAYRRWKINAAGQLRALLILARWPRAMDARRDAVRVSVTGYTARPKSAPAWMTTTERAAFRRGWTPPRLSTPDADNMVGAVLDALTDSGQCWRDDTQAILGDVSSTWAAAGESPHLILTLEAVPWPTPTQEPKQRTT